MWSVSFWCTKSLTGIYRSARQTACFSEAPHLYLKFVPSAEMKIVCKIQKEKVSASTRLVASCFLASSIPPSTTALLGLSCISFTLKQVSLAIESIVTIFRSSECINLFLCQLTAIHTTQFQIQQANLHPFAWRRLTQIRSRDYYEASRTSDPR